jgi:hypothetical protein
MSSANSNRAAAQKLIAIESTLSIRAAGFRAARLRMVLFVRPFAAARLDGAT